MGLWAVCLLLGAAALVVEPPPITYEESVDEVSEAQKRARWIACLLFIRNQFPPEFLDNVAQTSKFPKEPTVLRFKADFLVACVKQITLSIAEKYLSSGKSYTPDEQLVIETFSSISTEIFTQEDNDIGLTQEQEELLSQMDAVGGM
jgi:hypothetical protein